MVNCRLHRAGKGWVFKKDVYKRQGVPLVPCDAQRAEKKGRKSAASGLFPGGASVARALR